MPLLPKSSLMRVLLVSLGYSSSTLLSPKLHANLGKIGFKFNTTPVQQFSGILTKERSYVPPFRSPASGAVPMLLLVIGCTWSHN